MRKETVHTDFLVTSTSGDTKIKQFIRITRSLLKKKKVEPVESVFKNIYQSNTYKKGLGWRHFDNEPRFKTSSK